MMNFSSLTLSTVMRLNRYLLLSRFTSTIPGRKATVSNQYSGRSPHAPPQDQDVKTNHTKICPGVSKISLNVSKYLGRGSQDSRGGNSFVLLGYHSDGLFLTSKIMASSKALTQYRFTIPKRIAWDSWTGGGFVQHMRSKTFHSGTSFHSDPANEKLSLARAEKNVYLTSASTIFSIHEGVEIYYIKPDGTVNMPLTKSSMHIVRFDGPEQTHGSNVEMPPAFLHVGHWVYPLVPEMTPALLTAYGAYIFPDVLAKEEGAAVALIIPDTLPTGERKRFENIIKAYTQLEDEEFPRFQGSITDVPSIFGKSKIGSYFQSVMSLLSKGILFLSEWVSWMITKTTELGGKVIHFGSTKVQQQIKPALKTHLIDPKIKKGIIYAKQATTTAVKVTGYVVQKLADATVALASIVSPKVREQAAKLMPQTMKQDGLPKAVFDGIVEVSASGLKGLTAVYTGLTNASNTLRKSLSEETVHIVQHRYGNEAGALTEDTMNTVKNVSTTMLHAKTVAIKSLANKATKTTRNKILIDQASEKSQRKSSKQQWSLKSKAKKKQVTERN